MTPDLPSLEAELSELKAVALDESFLTRLEASADGTWLELTHQESRFENLLRESQAAKLDPAFLSDLEKILREIPLISNEKIVPFPNVTGPATNRGHRPIWAAAAVALIGASSALLVPTGKAPQNDQRQIASSSSAPAKVPAASNFVPSSFNRGLSEVRDEGVIWRANNQPHSLVRVVYKDQVVLKDAEGRTVHVEQPRIEYMLVPAKTD